MISPDTILHEYQRRWVYDRAKFKMGLMARQVGKSFCTAAEAVIDAHERKTDWVAMSAGERQSLEWMRKAKVWSRMFGFALANEFTDRVTPEAVMLCSEIHFPNGSRIISVPTNPSTARGYTANLILDEFAHHENPEEVWRAIFPSVSSRRNGDLRLRVVSTANGRGNKFFDLWSKDNRYSKHRVTIHDAVAQGLDVDVEELREGLDDSDAWAQEYECEFCDTASILLSYELIASCESDEATAACDWNGGRPSNPLFIGIDFGRKRDKTAAWTLEQIGDVMWTRDIFTLSDTSTPEQINILRPRIRCAERVSIDYTGPGVGFGDYLVEEFGEYNPAKDQFGKIELCTFTPKLLCEIMPKMKMAFERRAVRIPINREAREDLHGIQRVITASNNVSYRAPRGSSKSDGHFDRAYGLALAIRAASVRTTTYSAILI